MSSQSVTNQTLGEKLLEELTDVAGRPFIKNPLTFFMDTKATRTMLTICDTDSWKKDFSIAEKLFGNIFVSASYDGFQEEFQIHKDILKQRKKYPNIDAKEEYMETAKIWILPTKVHPAPTPSQFQSNFPVDFLPPNDFLNVVKIEVSNGQERQILYSMIDSGVLPSLLCIRWSKDLDQDYPTAFCAGHLTNLGYVHVRVTGDYHLYYYTGNNLYDTVSFQEVYLQNPMVKGIVDSVLPVNLKTGMELSGEVQTGSDSA